MLFKESTPFMYRYTFLILLLSVFVSCEDEVPTSEFIPKSFFKNTLDKLVANVNGADFFFDENPTALVTNNAGVNNLQIQFVSTKGATIILRVSVFVENDKTYTVNNNLDSNRFIAFYRDEKGNEYIAEFNMSSTTKNNNGTLDLDIQNPRTLNGTFSFEAQLDISNTNNPPEEVYITKGIIGNISY